jgi:predicted dehydrogenase
LKEVLESDADLVVITPVASHFEYTKQVLQAGKHAIVEKHLLPQYPSKGLAAIAKAKGLKLAVFKIAGG